MRLDELTFMIAGSLVSGVASVLLFAAWSQMRSATSIQWWAASYLINAVAVLGAAMGFQSGNAALIGAGLFLTHAAAATLWAGVRGFHGRAGSWLALAVLAAIWLAFAAILASIGSAALTTGSSRMLNAALYAAAAVELWRGRAERLAFRWPLLAVLALHAGVFLTGSVEIALGGGQPGRIPQLGSAFSLIHFEEIVFLLAGAAAFFLMCRERSEARAAAAARLDRVTGVMNRGAFFDQAEHLFREMGERGVALSLVAFDLDHFKAINDCHGHAVGDRVLKTFADTAAAVLRPGDLFGRLGGEEFAAVLPAASVEAAYVIADRVRHAFDLVPKPFAAAIIHATVSAGVAGARPDASLENLLELADRALYRAKAGGRNRVERADAQTTNGGRQCHPGRVKQPVQPSALTVI